MPLVKTLHNRGTNIVVEAHAEVLTLPTGDIGRWTRRFTTTVKRFVAAEAPTNKRPRWSHYGKPLKSTIRATTKYRPTEGRVYGAVGSTARHGYYVDQGTGVYAGNGPYAAKILPPWTHGGPTLYERTWHPGGGGAAVQKVLIKGQKGQGFLDAGLRLGFREMRVAPGLTPGGPSITEALNSAPSGLENFLGNTVADGAFIAQLTEWRQWRDEAWAARQAARKSATQAKRDAKTATAEAARATAYRKAAARRLHEERSKNLADYKASVAASKRRAAEQKARIKADAQRKAERARMQREKEAQTRAADKLQRGNRSMRNEAMAFLARIRQAYPNATLGSTTLSDGVVVYRVTYVTSDGETVRQNFAYGYGN